MHVLEELAVRGKPAEAADRNREGQIDDAAIPQIDDAVLEPSDPMDSRLVPPESGKGLPARRYQRESESQGARRAGAGRLGPHLVLNRALPGGLEAAESVG